MTARYAIYFAPKDNTPLALFGNAILQRTALELIAESPETVSAANDITQDAALLNTVTATPRHYGFHATLKAPFELAEGTTERALITAVDDVARHSETLPMPGLHPRVKSGFLALRFQQQPTAIKAFAMRCVEQFEPFRAPLSAYDIQRREPESLPPDQRDNLMRYGYPYVGDAFDFHMTLTGQLGQNLTGRDQKTFETAEAAVLAEIIAFYEKQVTDDPVLDRIAIYTQPDRQSHFRRLHEAAFRDSPVQ